MFNKSTSFIFVKGHYYKFRKYSFLAVLFILFSLPWLLNLYFSKMSPKLYILMINPGFLKIIPLVLIILGCLLYLLTVRKGRYWCGFLCPQTIGVFVTQAIENKLKKIIRRKIASYWQKLCYDILLFIILFSLSIITSLHILGLFYPIYHLLFFFTDHAYEIFLIIFFLAILIYILSSHLKTKFCQYICPYARFQSIMISDKTQVVYFDHSRVNLTDGKNDCIDCKMCIKVCPTRIDIREGFQQNCINCGACVDACNKVMKNIKKPIDLIKYASVNQSTKSFQNKGVYSAIVIVLIASIFIGLTVSNQKQIEIFIQNDRNTQTVNQNHEFIKNFYKIKYVNNTKEDLDLVLTSSAHQLILKGHTHFKLVKGASIELPIMAIAKYKDLKMKQFEFYFKFDVSGKTYIKKAKFLSN
ncbi:hypothetical protein CF386_10475 [Paraphotobacterium marinum]|uniref:4Fe-4S ferredoxin-type domain-containing protein n=1 Tax=Paraphotobacterium marinum TaxID=1755811 RepID=A0A220VGV6_9GAMM|nr:4Fe-4S dicluster domain-containing protein [Paraphotobacterium marinum]ASK79476.1 hypothetical protein CF386_10475 [Paraphotobacterium marinum]